MIDNSKYIGCYSEQFFSQKSCRVLDLADEVVPDGAHRDVVV